MAKDSDRVRDVSVEVYKIRLGADGAERMLKDDDDGGVKLRSRAGSYDPLTRAYMNVLNAK